MRPEKYNRIVEELEAKILGGDATPGERLPSQSRLCELYGVSRSCAQKALDALAAKGLIESKPGKGVYVRGGSEASEARPFKNVVVVFHEGFRFESHPLDNFGLEMLWGVEEELRSLGANCIIRKERKGSNLAKPLSETGADAFIVDREFDDAQVRPLGLLKKPVAMLGRLSSLPFVSSSLPNHADCFLQTFLRLADEGFGRVGFVHPGGNYYDDELAWAFERAASLRPQSSFRKATMQCSLSSGSATGGVEGALDRLLSGAWTPEAVVFSNDWFAAQALEILKRRGVEVPAEMKIIGCYGIDLGAKSKPSISSLSVDPREIGRRAARLLADSALLGKAPSVERVPFEFVERESFKWSSQS